MAAPRLEVRVAALESEVAELKRVVEKTTTKEPWWHTIYGAFEGSHHFKEATDLGRKYRESLRPKAQKRKGKRNHGDT